MKATEASVAQNINLFSLTFGFSLFPFFINGNHLSSLPVPNQIPWFVVNNTTAQPSLCCLRVVWFLSNPNHPPPFLTSHLRLAQRRPNSPWMVPSGSAIRKSGLLRFKINIEVTTNQNYPHSPFFYQVRPLWSGQLQAIHHRQSVLWWLCQI